MKRPRFRHYLWLYVMLTVAGHGGQAFAWFWSTGTPSTPHPAVARIIALDTRGASLGTGTLVAVNQHHGLVVTNWHVVRDAKGAVLVQFPDGFASPATVLHVDREWDLAALAIWRPRAAPVAIAVEPPRPGEILTIAGYGQGDYRISYGPCTQYLAPSPGLPLELIELRAKARQGDSGGPIFNARGELAGVLFGSGFSETMGAYCGRVRAFLVPLRDVFNNLPPPDPLLVQAATAGPPGGSSAAVGQPAAPTGQQFGMLGQQFGSSAQPFAAFGQTTGAGPQPATGVGAISSQTGSPSPFQLPLVASTPPGNGTLGSTNSGGFPAGGPGTTSASGASGTAPSTYAGSDPSSSPSTAFGGMNQNGLGTGTTGQNSLAMGGTSPGTSSAGSINQNSNQNSVAPTGSTFAQGWRDSSGGVASSQTTGLGGTSPWQTGLDSQQTSPGYQEAARSLASRDSPRSWTANSPAGTTDSPASSSYGSATSFSGSSWEQNGNGDASGGASSGLASRDPYPKSDNGGTTPSSGGATDSYASQDAYAFQDSYSKSGGSPPYSSGLDRTGSGDVASWDVSHRSSKNSDDLSARGGKDSAANRQGYTASITTDSYKRASSDNERDAQDASGTFDFSSRIPERGSSQSKASKTSQNSSASGYSAIPIYDEENGLPYSDKAQAGSGDSSRSDENAGNWYGYSDHVGGGLESDEYGSEYGKYTGGSDAAKGGVVSASKRRVERKKGGSSVPGRTGSSRQAPGGSSSRTDSGQNVERASGGRARGTTYDSAWDGSSSESSRWGDSSPDDRTDTYADNWTSDEAGDSELDRGQKSGGTSEQWHKATEPAAADGSFYDSGEVPHAQGNADSGNGQGQSAGARPTPGWETIIGIMGLLVLFIQSMRWLSLLYDHSHPRRRPYRTRRRTAWSSPPPSSYRWYY